jgi:hypothetical protein
MPIQYLLDEHMPPAYRTQLLSRESNLTIWKIGMPGVPPSGTLDPSILLWCEMNNFILVTNNRKSMPVHLADHLAAGHHVPGILTVDITRDMAQNLDDLLLVALAAVPGEYADRIVYLPL